LFVKPKINCVEAFLQQFRLRRASSGFYFKKIACGALLFMLLFLKISPAARFYSDLISFFFACGALLFRLLFQNFSLRRASIEAFISKKSPS